MADLFMAVKQSRVQLSIWKMYEHLWSCIILLFSFLSLVFSVLFSQDGTFAKGEVVSSPAKKIGQSSFVDFGKN